MIASFYSMNVLFHLPSWCTLCNTDGLGLSCRVLVVEVHMLCLSESPGRAQVL